MSEQRATLLPRFVGNSIEIINVLSDAGLNAAHGINRAVVGIDNLATKSLTQQAALIEARLNNNASVN